MLRPLQYLALRIYALVVRSGILHSGFGERVFVSLYLWYKRRLEAWQIEHLKGYVSASSTVIDVGANIGFVTLQVAEWVGNSGRVIAIEPEAINCRRLRSHLARNPGVADRVLVIDGAAAEFDGEVQLNVNDLHPGDHRIGEPAGQGVSTPCTKLDTLYALYGRGPVTLIKIDVQGAELRVLQGAGKVLTEFKPAVFLEVEDEMLRNQGASADALFDYLQERGYRSYVITKTGAVGIDWADARKKVVDHGYFDFLFLHEPAIHRNI